MAFKILVCLAALLFASQSHSVPLGPVQSGHIHKQSPFQKPVLSAPTPLSGVRAPVEGIIQQRLDHTNPDDVRSWDQRYLINEQFYEIGGPMFVMMSLEGAAIPDLLRGGQMMELALLYKAKAFVLEERFYGNSRPMPDTSEESLKFSTPEQNIGDFAAFIRSIKISHPGAKVIAFGGSFGGSYVAWAKQKYPELIDGAVVSSAPLLSVYGFPEFMEEITRVLGLADEACAIDLKEAITAVESILAEGESGGETLANVFNLCAPLDVNNPLDVGNFFRLFPDSFVLAVETAHSLAVVQDTCDRITNPLYGATPFDRLVTLNTPAVPSGCVEVRYDVFLPFAQNVSWDTPATASRNYMYQTCTFNGDYPSSESTNQPFGHAFPMEGFVQFCADVFSPIYDATFIQNGVAATNEMFGGLTPDVTNTVFVQGSFDPWRVLGVTEDLSETATAIVIEGTSHISDMLTASASDPEELIAARIQIRDLVGQWIS